MGFLDLEVLPKWILKCTKWRIQKALPDSHKNVVETSLIPTGLSPHVSKDRIFRATIQLKERY